MGYPVVLGITGTWLLTDDNGKKLGLCAVWVEGSSALPAGFHMMRAGNSLKDVTWTAEPTTAYGTLTGANKAARKNSFQRIWNKFVADESFDLSAADHHEWAHNGKIRKIPNFTL